MVRPHQLNCGLFRVDAVVSENREQQRMVSELFEALVVVLDDQVHLFQVRTDLARRFSGSRKVRTDLARRYATAARIGHILLSIVVVSVSSRVCCFLFLLWRFRLSSAWCFAFRRVGFLEEY